MTSKLRDYGLISSCDYETMLEIVKDNPDFGLDEPGYSVTPNVTSSRGVKPRNQPLKQKRSPTKGPNS